MFERVTLTDTGRLQCSRPIPAFDFVAVIPVGSVISALSVEDESARNAWPSTLKVSPANFVAPLAWWPGVEWGQLCLSAFLARTLLLKQPTGIHGHLRMLSLPPNVPPALRHVGGAIQHRHFTQLTDPLAATCRVPRPAFNAAFVEAFTLLSLHGRPLWTSTGLGHPAFSATSYGRAGGDLIGLIPIATSLAHSPSPNCAVGVPSDDMKDSLELHHGVSRASEYFVIQALEALQPGAVLTVDRNESHGLDAASFEQFFGFPITAEEATHQHQ